MTTITIDRELLEQALVALSAPNHCVFSEPPICVDIRAALAAPATAPTQPAFESWCASMGFIPTQARYETWQAATAAAINKICADVQAAGFANGGIETPADVAPEILFQLKEKIEAATAAALERAAVACEVIENDRWALYKGRPPYTGAEPGRADNYVQGESGGAGSCASAIRALKDET